MEHILNLDFKCDFCGCVLAQFSHRSQNVYMQAVHVVLLIAVFQGGAYDGLCLVAGVLQ